MIGEIDERVEPVECQHEERERLPQVIEPFDMHTLVQQHMRKLLRSKPGRHIDLRAEHAEHKRRADPVAFIYARL